VPSEDEIVDYGEETWEVSFNSRYLCREQADIQSILRYMVSSGLSNGMIANRPRDSVLQLLLSSGLMADM
jgi:transcription initiation factor TFIIH subunit 4